MTVFNIIGVVFCIILISFVFKILVKYSKLHEEMSKDRIFLVTLVEFFIHMKTHSDTETITNDMINAVKTCINRGYYEIKPVDGICSDSEAYENFAEQVFEFIDTIDKE